MLLHLKEALTQGNLLENVWNDVSFRTIVHYLLALIANYEDIDNDRSVDERNTLVKFFENYPNNDLIKAVILLDSGLEILNLTVYQLRQEFGRQLSVLYSFSVNYTTAGGCNDSSIEIEETTYVDFEQICYRVRTDLRPFVREEDQIRIKVDQWSLHIYGYQNVLLDLGGHDRAEIFQVDDSQVFSAMITDDITSDYTVGKLIALRLAAIYRAMPTGSTEKKCSETESALLCQAKCRNALIRERCNCSSTQMMTVGSLVDQCRLGRVAACQKQNISNYSLLECLVGCPQACEQRIYNRIYTAEKYRVSNVSTEESDIIVTAISFDYPIFEEIPAQTFPSFIGALGGILGLWLGLDISSITQYILNLLTQWKSDRKVHDVSSSTSHLSSTSDITRYIMFM